MICYAFDKHVIPLIQAGLVCQTLASRLLRHPGPGERIRLVDKEHFRPVIDDPICAGADRCEIAWKGGRIHSIREGGMPVTNHRLFARSLGWSSVEAMERDLGLRHGRDWFEGVMITWIVPPANEGLGVAA